jgi:hypothetical protein
MPDDSARIEALRQKIITQILEQRAALGDSPEQLSHMRAVVEADSFEEMIERLIRRDANFTKRLTDFNEMEKVVNGLRSEWFDEIKKRDEELIRKSMTLKAALEVVAGMTLTDIAYEIAGDG